MKDVVLYGLTRYPDGGNASRGEVVGDLDGQDHLGRSIVVHLFGEEVGVSRIECRMGDRKNEAAVRCEELRHRAEQW